MDSKSKADSFFSAERVAGCPKMDIVRLQMDAAKSRSDAAELWMQKIIAEAVHAADKASEDYFSGNKHTENQQDLLKKEAVDALIEMGKQVDQNMEIDEI